MKLLSLFSGIGAFEKALERLNVNYDLAAYCEIDKYASKSYAAIHGVDESLNLGDITKVDTSLLPSNIDLITYGFPCQDISIAGQRKGFVDESGNITKSGLFFNALHIIEKTQPQIAIAENVKALVSKKFTTEFKIVLDCLNKAGYNSYCKVLNAKDYGIPQNRERVFIIYIRKDININFKWPLIEQRDTRLKDFLEDDIDEKYFINKEIVEMRNISCNAPRCIQVATLKTKYECNGRVYSPDGLSPTITTCKGGGRTPKVFTNGRIRCFTPKECWRLMGFDDEDFEKVQPISNSQLYKQAGNSIVVNVLEKLLKGVIDYV